MVWQLTNDNKILTLISASELEIAQLALTFEKESPNAKWDPRVKKGYWTGRINYFKANKYLPAGLWYEVVEMAKEYDFELKIGGIENKFDFDIDKEEFLSWVNEKWENSPMKPRDYQIESAFNIIKYKCSLSEIATSAGKTLIIYMILAYLLEQEKSKKILMIVPSVDLVIQSSEDFYQYNSDSVQFPIDIQQIFAGSVIRAKSNIVVGTFQSLVKKDKSYYDDFDTVVVDESHRVAAHSVKNVLEKCTNADRIFGLTGTVPKKGTLDRLTLCAYTGPIITSIRADFLMEQGYITKCEVIAIEMNYVENEIRNSFANLFARSSEDRKKLLSLEQNFAINSDVRLEFITDMILKNHKNSLVLFHRIDYGNKLYNMLRQKSNRKILYIDGGIDKDRRSLYKENLEDEEEVVMVASFGTFSTGINVKNIHVIYLTESFKSEVVIRQSIGRGLRKHIAKTKLLIIDFVDDFTIGKFKNYLYKHGKARQEIYEEQNFPYSVKNVDLLKIYKIKEKQ